MPSDRIANFPASEINTSLCYGELANAPQKLAHILNALPSGVIIVNCDGIVVEANPAANVLLGAPLKNERWINIINRVFSPKDDDGYEVSLKNGRRIKLVITPLMPEDGQLMVLTDLTETRLLQNNISHLQRLSALGEMVATLAHQVRTPLSAALLYASNLTSRTLSSDAQQKFQSKLLTCLNKLEHQVNDMLLMAKGQQNAMGEPVTAKIIYQQVQTQCEAVVLKYGAKLIIENNSSGQILANTGALSSAVSNLIVNSLEANATIIYLKACDSDCQLKLCVVDNGNGIDAEMKAKILTPFFTTKQQGTGLGLAVVQSVVSNHGGRLTVKSEVNQGCIFCLYFSHVN